MKTSDFYYDLPQELIAQHPASQRDASRLMVLNPGKRSLEHTVFSDLPRFLRPGDCLVVNDTRVIPARLIGTKRSSGISVEILLLKRLSETRWETLVRPGRRLPVGTFVDLIPNRLSAEIVTHLPNGNREVEFTFSGIWEEVLEEAGTMPLPPYIRERLEDPTRYNTVYAKQDGSAAAPTAGLHFTPELLDRLESQGVRRASVTLHVGLGTFRPVHVDSLEEHTMHSEYYEISPTALQQIQKSRDEGGRVISVGTTSTRVLETVARRFDGQLQPCSGWTDIFLYPGCSFQIVDALITNFHLPESTLLMLVSAMAGRTFILDAYREAVRERYRFFSFGDAMLIEGKIPPEQTR